VFIFNTIDDGETNVVRAVTSSLLDEGSKASTLHKVENKTTKDVQQSSILETSIEVNKGVKRLLEKDLDAGDVSGLERVEKRARISEKDGNEQSVSMQSRSTKTANEESIHLDNDTAVEENNGKNIRPERESNKSKNQRITPESLPVKAIRQQNDKHINQRPNDRILNKSLVSSEQRTLPAKKKIQIRKRPIPRTRPNKQSKATWVEKYNIEDCCIILDLCNRVYETGKK
jgi:hypothetical protein